MNFGSKSSGGTVGAKGNKFLILAIAVAAIFVFAVFVVFGTKALKSTPYYIVKTPVLAQQPITPDMVQKIEVKDTPAAAVAVTMADLQSGQVQAEFPLNTGDVLTSGNTSSGRDTLYGYLMTEKREEMASEGIKQEDYKNWVLTSFSVGADDAVGGRIHRGSYFDVMIVTDTGAFYPFRNMEAIDTTVSLSGASSNRAADSAEAHSGQTSQYFVKMSPHQAARLQWYMNSFNGSVKLLLNDKSDVEIDGEKVMRSTKGANPYDAFNASEEPTPKSKSINIEDEDEAEEGSDSGFSSSTEKAREGSGSSGSRRSSRDSSSEPSSDSSSDSSTDSTETTPPTRGSDTANTAAVR